MNERKIASVLQIMAVGESRRESWFIDRGITRTDLDTAVSLGLLSIYEKDPNDFMSNAGYTLTREGRDFAWKRD